MKTKQETKLPKDMTKLSPIQQEVAGYTETAKKEPPKIDYIKDLFTRIELEVPKGVSKGPEYDYAWLALADLSSIHGSKWEVVTRSNHPNAPNRCFDMSGGILYKGQNILAYCFRSVREAEQEAIVARYNQKTEQMTKTEDQAVEGQAQRIDPNAAGKVVNQATVDPDAIDDF